MSFLEKIFPKQKEKIAEEKIFEEEAIEVKDVIAPA